MRIYAKCLDGQERDALSKIDEALRTSKTTDAG
jgi:hypothetical protein